MTKRRFAALAALALALGLTAQAARAQEDFELGKMWTFEHVPKEYFKQEHGFELTQEWLDRVRMASLRFGGGCSASFVSPKGLVMTNHHCARDMIAKVCPPGEDWVKNGFVARSLAEEPRLPDLSVQQLIEMIDVTDRLNEGITDADDVLTTDRKRKENEAKVIEWAKAERPGLQPRIIALYQGGNFQLYLYKVYTDVRLVCAPHLQTAHFGGDPDNFTYPRFGIDFTFCRAYENDEPVDSSANYFRFDPKGAKEGDSVFVTGNPGSTNRLMTLAQLEYNRDVYYPMILDVIDQLLGDLRSQAESSPEAEKELRTRILGIENTQKAFTGYLAGLRDASLMDAKRKAESAFRAKVKSDAALEKRFGDAWDALARTAEERRKMAPSSRFHRDLGLPIIRRIVAVLDAMAPDLAPAEKERLIGRAKSVAVAYPNEQAHAAVMRQVALARRWLGADDPFVKALMQNGDTAAAIDRLGEESPFAKNEFIDQIAAGTLNLGDVKDPALTAARALKAAIQAREAREPELAAEENVQKTRIGQACFAIYGTTVSADATGSLRLSDGKVKRYAYNGTIAPAWTSFYGLYARNVEFANVHPFDLPEPWLAKKDRIDLSRPVDFVSTNDIIGGNSGSPVIDKDLHAVGLVFDGNIEMLPNNFLYRDEVQRTVSVHTAAIVEALDKIYGAWRVLAELLES